MDKFTVDSAWTSVLFFLAVCVAITQVINAYKAIKGLNKSDDIRQMLANDKARLDSHEIRIGEIEKTVKKDHDGIKVLVKGVLSLVEHELHNGNEKQLDESKNELQDWMMK